MSSTSTSYVGPSGPSDARVMLVGEHPGPDELREGKPFVGSSGWCLTAMLQEAGIPRQEAFVTNVLRFMPTTTTENIIISKAKQGLASGFPQFLGKWCHPTVIEHVEHLRREVDTVQPNVIVALGGIALWALLNEDGITSWRGYVEPCRLTQRPDGKPFKVIPTFHPAGVQRNWPWRWDCVQDFRRAKRESETPCFIEPQRNFIVRPQFSDVQSYLHNLLAHIEGSPIPIKVACDIETRKRHIACIGLGTGKEDAICIPLMCVERKDGYWSASEEIELWYLLQKVLTHPNIWVIGQNFHYDAQYFARRMGFVPRLRFDTMIAHHVCFPAQRKALDYIVPRYCAHPRHWKSDGREWEVKKEPEDRLWRYNCQDDVYTFECAEVLEKVVDKMGLRPQFEFQSRLFYPLLKMMLRGVRRDEEMQKVLSQELDDALRDRETYFRTLLGHDLNPNSPPQMHKLFYGDFRQQVIKDRKSGSATLNDEALDTLVQREPLLKPLIQAIREYRSARVFKSTFIDAAVDEDGRIRCSYNQAGGVDKHQGAKTFRLTSSESVFGTGGNLQNVPEGDTVRIALYCKEHGSTSISKLMDVFEIADKDQATFTDEVDKAEEAGYVTVEERKGGSIVHYRFVLPNVRKLFLPDPDHVIMEWDLKGADPQIVAWEANDVLLKQALREGLDIHELNRKDLNISSRKKAKLWVHGTNYGAKARTAAANCGMTVHESEKARLRWFQIHPGIAEWHRRTEALLQSTCSTRNIFGYQIYWFDRVDALLPKALAWQPQSCVAIIINIGLVNVDENLPQVQILMQTHDSLTAQCHRNAAPEMVPKIRKELAIPVPYSDPLVIPVTGKWSEKSWGECKEIPL